MSGTLVHKAYVLKADGTRQDFPQGVKPTLADAQKAVGGYVEALPLRLCRTPNLTVYGNEDGRVFHLPKNVKATDLLGYITFGDVLVLEGWRSLA